MIATLLHRILNPRQTLRDYLAPTIVHVFAPAWDENRRVRQAERFERDHPGFIVADPAALWPHGTESAMLG